MKSIVPVLAVVALSACTSSPSGTSQAGAAPAVGQGRAAFGLRIGGKRCHGLLRAQVRRVGGRQSRITMRDRGKGPIEIVSGDLPAGRYVTKTIKCIPQSFSLSSVSQVTLKGELPGFSVSPGRTTRIGILAVRFRPLLSNAEFRKMTLSEQLSYARPLPPRVLPLPASQVR